MSKTSSLSLLAKTAKARLRCNNYIQGQVITKPTNFKDYIEKSAEEKDSKQNPQKIVVNTYDELLYKRVCELLDKGLENANPVGQLIDKKVFLGLDFEAKQHYIATLSYKYKILKQRYYKEHMQRYNFGW